MATYNSAEEYTNAVLTRLQKSSVERAYFLAVQQTIGNVGVRIFERGMATSGAIGKYNSSQPIYISNFNSPRNGKLIGKGGKRKYENGKLHKTTYYPSYKDFREKMGRSGSGVNLVLSGRLYRNFLNSLDVYKKGGKAVTIPSMIVPRKLGEFSYAISLRQENMDKAMGAQEHFGKKIFDLSKNEKADFAKRVKFEIMKALKE